MVNKSIIKILSDTGIKITPQRIHVLEVIISLGKHPTAEEIINLLQLTTPHTTPGTVYKTLDLFVQKGILKRVKTDDGVFRYDQILEKHHHLYCAESERIEDYFDDKLNIILENYFKTNKIKNFNIKEIKLQITGNFTDKQSKPSLTNK
jgi:Fur family peroxide stress response transcriptional regulator